MTLPVPVDLRKVAEWTGTSVEQIQALNPELRRWTTPLKDDDYRIKVPAGTGTQLTEKIASAPPHELLALSEYVVRRGDTLTTIARRLKVSWLDVADANGLTKRSIIRPGQRLVVPRAPAALLAARTSRPVRRAASASAGTAGRVRVPGAPRRHAVEDRARVRDDRLGHQGLEQPEVGPDHRRRPPDDLPQLDVGPVTRSLPITDGRCRLTTAAVTLKICHGSMAPSVSFFLSPSPPLRIPA